MGGGGEQSINPAPVSMLTIPDFIGMSRIGTLEVTNLTMTMYSNQTLPKDGKSLLPDLVT
jgi:hypothetical protein